MPSTSVAKPTRKSKPPSASLIPGTGMPAENALKVKKRNRAASGREPRRPDAVISYVCEQGVDRFVERIAKATPMELVDVERYGVKGRFIKDFSRRMGVPAVRLYEILGVPKATVEKRSSDDTEVTGAGGQAAIAMARLLAKAQAIVAQSTSPDANGFDAARWLGQWIERPQPALGGHRPAELISTPTGVDMVSRLLGTIESGAYP
jgi:putative toxin-antitoxin system antitoxin component (TIGR02293 family)